MQKITLGTTYYQNPEDLNKFLDHHYEHVDELIIVDDGSSIHPLSEMRLRDPRGILRLFRVKKDYGFNSHGCRNLIMNVATNDWVMLLDCDRVIMEPAYAFELIKSRKLEKKIRYRLVAHFIKVGQGTHASVNDYIICKSHFFSAGGYDEELIGVRDGDRSFFRQLIAAGGKEKLLQIDMVLMKQPSSYAGVRFRSKLDRSLTKEMRDILSKREGNPEPNKNTLTFEWEQINLGE